MVAILFGEADAIAYGLALQAASKRLFSALTRVELSCVVEGRKGERGRAELERFLALLDAEIVAVSPQQAILAVQAFSDFGKGPHPAGLNIGDCFSYALAAATGYPLLFKGDDFARTDLRSALVAQSMFGPPRRLHQIRTCSGRPSEFQEGGSFLLKKGSKRLSVLTPLRIHRTRHPSCR